MAPPPPRVEAATRCDREVPTLTKNTTSKTSSDEGSNERRAEKRYEEREDWCLVSSSPLSREMDDDDDDDDASFYFSNASRAVAANKRTTTRFSLVLALATFVLTRSHFPCNKQATNGNFDRQRG